MIKSHCLIKKYAKGSNIPYYEIEDFPKDLKEFKELSSILDYKVFEKVKEEKVR